LPFFKMNKLVLHLCFVFIALTMSAQDSLLVGKSYFEDQLYISITNNTLVNKPDELKSKGISIGLATGFIKDISLNEKGNIALGIGIGYAYQKFNQNMMIGYDDTYAIIDGSYLRNKFEKHSIEIPFEIRIRPQSSPTTYRFWRLYIGAKAGFSFYNRSMFLDDSGKIVTKNIQRINNWYYGPQISIGYNVINLYAFYNVNNLFDNLVLENQSTLNDATFLNIGFQLYIF